MAIVRALVNSIVFRVDKDSLQKVGTAVTALKKSLAGIDGRIKMALNQPALTRTREGIRTVRTDLELLRDKTVTITQRTVRETIGGREPREPGALRGRRRERGPSELVAPALGIGAGLLSAETIVHLTDDFAQLNATIRSFTSNDAELEDARNRIMGIARAARLAPEGVANLYANFKQLQPLTHQTNDQLDATVTTLTKMLALAHQTPAQTSRIVRQIDNAVSAGTLTKGQLNTIRRDSNSFYRYLQDAAGGPDQLRAWLKSRENNSRGFLNLLHRLQPSIDKQFTELPFTASNAMQAIKTDMEEITGKLLVNTGAISALLEPIVHTFDAIDKATDRAAKALGGYKNLVVDLAAAVSGFLTAAIAQTAVWAVEIGIVSLPFVAAGAAISAAVLAIVDVWHWFRGQPSLTGYLFGNKASWQPEIDKLKAGLAPIFAGFKSTWGKELANPEVRKNLGMLSADFASLGGVIEKIAASIGKIVLPGMFKVWDLEARAMLAVFQALLWTVNETIRIAAGFGTMLGGVGAAEDRTKLAAEIKAHTPGDFSFIQRQLVTPIGSTVTPSAVLPGNRTMSNSNTNNVSITQNITAPSGSAPALAGMAERGAKSGVQQSLDQPRPSYPGFAFPGLEFGTVVNP